MNISLSNLDLSANTTPNSHLKMKLQKGMYNSHINLNKDFASISNFRGSSKNLLVRFIKKFYNCMGILYVA